VTAHRVTIVTNGNYFSHLGLRRLLAAAHDDIEVQVFVTTGLRKTSGNRAKEALQLLRKWGLRYTGYKVATYALPFVGERIGRRTLTVRTACQRLEIPCQVIRSVNSEPALELIRDFDPDLVISFSCPYKIGKELLAVPRIGSMNVHSSLLPAYAGVCTYIHVLADGQRVTGVTVHEMVSRFDAGRILAQQEVPIGARTSVFSLFATQCDIAGTLLYEAVDRSLDAGAIGGHEQDFGQRTYRGEPTRSDVARLRSNGHRLLLASNAKRLVAGLPGGPTDHPGVE
jgi:folate-dependent phosphoribosylglycinamide formyltransferase PurN